MTALDPAAHARLEVETSPGSWTDVTGASRSVSVSRHDGGPGTLSAEVLDAALDPTQTAAVRLGRGVRLLVRDAAGTGWAPAFTGTLDNVEAEPSDDPLAPAGRGTSVRLTGADLVARMAATAEPRGVGTIDDLRWLAAGLPFVVNGSTEPLASGTVVARNENATLWDQVLVTRDSALGHAWVDPADRLQAWDAARVPGTVAAALGPDRYRTVDTDFSPAQVINSVVVNWRRYNVGSETSVDVAYGPYDDPASVAEWGVRQASFTVQGATEDEAAIAAYAQEVLARNAGAVARARSAVVPLRTTEDLALVRDVDLNSLVQVTLPDGLTVQTLRVTGVEHQLTPRGWVTTLEFTVAGAVAALARTPGTGVSAAPPGSITADELAPAVVDQLNHAVVEYVAEYAVNSSEATAPTSGWSSSTPTRSPGTFVWTRTRVTSGDGATSTTSPALLTGNTGATGAQGGTGPTGVSVTAVTPYYALVASGAAAPAKPTVATPPAPWVLVEPAYSANTDLYRTEKVTFSNSTYVYTAVSKVSSYAAADAAMQTASGKNSVTYSSSGPGTSANAAGDVWFQFNASNQITGQWEGRGGTTWVAKTLASAVIANLDAGKLTAGSAFTNNLSVKSTLTLGDASTNGAVESFAFAASAAGVRMDKSGLNAKGGTLSGTKIVVGDSETSGERIIVRKDGAGGIIETFTGLDSETAGFIDPATSEGIVSPTLTISTGTVPVNAVPGKIVLRSSNVVGRVDLHGHTKMTTGFTSQGASYVTSGGLDVVGGMSLQSGWFRVDNIDTYGTAKITMRESVEIVGSGKTLSIINPPQGGSANVNINGTNGNIRQISSTRRVKRGIRALRVDTRKALALEPRIYERIDREEGDPDREVGFIAEEAEELGLDEWVVYGSDGEVFSFDYYKWVVALQAIVRDQEARIRELEGAQ